MTIEATKLEVKINQSDSVSAGTSRLPTFHASYEKTIDAAVEKE